MCASCLSFFLAKYVLPIWFNVKILPKIITFIYSTTNAPNANTLCKNLWKIEEFYFKFFSNITTTKIYFFYSLESHQVYQLILRTWKSSKSHGMDIFQNAFWPIQCHFPLDFCVCMRASVLVNSIQRYTFKIGGLIGHCYIFISFFTSQLLTNPLQPDFWPHQKMFIPLANFNVNIEIINPREIMLLLFFGLCVVFGPIGLSRILWSYIWFASFLSSNCS